MKDPSPKFHRRFKLQYGLLIGLRLFIILTSTSFIHPDEHFQNTEIAIEDVFRPTYDHHHPDHRTWEWDPSRLSDRSIGRGPVRSIVPIWLTSHLGLLILKRLHALGFISGSSSHSPRPPPIPPVDFLISPPPPFFSLFRCSTILCHHHLSPFLKGSPLVRYLSSHVWFSSYSRCPSTD